jgi:hypothetical protein
MSTKNTDFMQLGQFSLDNLVNIAQQIAKVIFSGTGDLPSGTKSNKQGTDAVKQSVSDFSGEGAKAVTAISNYTAARAIDVISSIILSTNTTSAISYSSELKSVPIGYGMQLFVAVCSASYQNQAFLSNDIIYEYLYFADVKFSKKQAQTEGSIFLATITAQAYESSKATYDSLIDQANQNLKKLSNDSLIDQANQNLKKLSN